MTTPDTTPPHSDASALRNTSPPTKAICGDLLSACGVEWDAADIARFLHYCSVETTPDGITHLIWTGARSRGRGNTAWYGSFSTQGKSVRAHKFYAVAVLGLRPRSGVHHLDHTCPNSLCVSCVKQEVEWINLKLRWIRVQVGLDEDKIRDGVVEALVQQPQEWFDDYDWRDFQHWITEDNRWRFDPMHPLNFSRYCEERSGKHEAKDMLWPER